MRQCCPGSVARGPRDRRLGTILRLGEEIAMPKRIDWYYHRSG